MNFHQHDFTDRIENNPESTALLRACKDKINKQCKITLDALLRGEVMSTWKGLTVYGMGDTGHRIRDLRNFFKIKIEQRVVTPGKFKEWWLSPETIAEIQSVLNEEVNEAV